MLDYCLCSKILVCLCFQVFHNESHLHSICHDFLLCLRCSRLLAHTSILLDCSLLLDNEAPDSTHDQIQIHPLQHREAGEKPLNSSYNLSIITVFFPTRTRINQFSFLFILCDAEIHREDGCHDQQFWLIRDVLQRECTRRRDHMIGIYFFYQDSSMKIFIWVWGLSNLSRNFLGQLLSLYTLVIFSCSLLLLNFHCWTKFLGTNKQRVEWTGVYIYWWRKWK